MSKPISPRIRVATPRDLPAVRDLLIETWHDTYDPIYGHAAVAEITGRWHSLASLSLQVNLTGFAFLLAELPKHGLVGTALAGPSESAPGDVDLRRLYVRPAEQRLGVGSAMLAELIARYPAARVIRLEVEPRNQKAIAFYERHGFRRAGEVEHQGGDANVWRADVMERTLAAT